MTCIDGAMDTRRAIRRSVRNFGQSLGPTPQAVASTLDRWSVRGVPKDPGGCAIARCLQAILMTEEAVKEVSVGDRTIRVTRRRGRFPVIIRMPKPVWQFVWAFDVGCYPELVDTGYSRRCTKMPSPTVTKRNSSTVELARR
jgi:hypothetical protein